MRSSSVLRRMIGITPREHPAGASRLNKHVRAFNLIRVLFVVSELERPPKHTEIGVNKILAVARVQQTELKLPLFAAYTAFQITIVNLGFLALYPVHVSTPRPDIKFLRTQIARASSLCPYPGTSPFRLY